MGRNEVLIDGSSGGGIGKECLRNVLQRQNRVRDRAERRKIKTRPSASRIQPPPAYLQLRYRV